MPYKIENYNVYWTRKGKSSCDSMPSGNGDIGVNVWVEDNSSLMLYIGKNDAWNDNMRLLKLGRVRVNFSPNPFIEGHAFSQELKLAEASIEIIAGMYDTKIKIWVDANNPVIHIETESKNSYSMEVVYENWRREERVLKDQELHSAYSMLGSMEPVIELPDNIFSPQKDSIIWCHRNENTIYPLTMELQGLEEFDGFSDPILNRTFGGIIKGEGLVGKSENKLETAVPLNKSRISIGVNTAVADNLGEWLKGLMGKMQKYESVDIAALWNEHCIWWKNFWSRSHISLLGSGEKETITRGYVLQRYINACGGRGEYPIKFNGSIFTMDTYESIAEKNYDVDYRRWGGPYWFQNTRLIYWPMLSAGDFDLMKPLFRMYVEALPLAKYRTIKYYGHEGAFFPETMCFWGAYANGDYGWDREGKEIGYVENPYIRYYWSGGLELTVLMLDYYTHTGDRTFSRDTLIPFADAILDFYMNHYSIGEDGKIKIYPAMSLETWHDAVNPLPEIAGLTYVTGRLLSLPQDIVSDVQMRKWEQLSDKIPIIPTICTGRKKRLLAAEEIVDKESRNWENPELYAVFPYRIFGVGKPDFEVGISTFEHRGIKDNFCWHQDAIQASYLGLADCAKILVAENFAHVDNECRFPAFWGPHNDWTPDQDHGGMASMALQAMLIQTEGDSIMLFPAWPKEWDVDFRLHAPLNTVVEGVYRSGRLESLSVTPEVRIKDLVVMNIND